jgi:hypothetical protein
MYLFNLLLCGEICWRTFKTAEYVKGRSPATGWMKRGVTWAEVQKASSSLGSPSGMPMQNCTRAPGWRCS